MATSVQNDKYGIHNTIKDEELGDLQMDDIGYNNSEDGCEMKEIVPVIDSVNALSTDDTLSNIKKQLNHRTWNVELEDLMKGWEKAAGNRELHLEAANRWNTISNRLYVPLILLNTLAGVGMYGVASNSLDYKMYYMYAIGGINILSAYIASLAKYFKPDEKVQQHEYMAKCFGSFYRTMTLELGLSRDIRMPSDELSRWAKTEYDRMQKESPTLPTEVIKSFKRKHQYNTKLNLPESLEKNFTIKVHGREETHDDKKETNTGCCFQNNYDMKEYKIYDCTRNQN